jgi:hypothetical protein
MCAGLFKEYDASLHGHVKVSHFGFIFKNLVEDRHISSKLLLRDVLLRLEDDGLVHLNAFISWIETVRTKFCFAKRTPFIAKCTPLFAKITPKWLNAHLFC